MPCDAYAQYGSNIGFGASSHISSDEVFFLKDLEETMRTLEAGLNIPLHLLIVGIFQVATVLL